MPPPLLAQTAPAAPRRRDVKARPGCVLSRGHPGNALGGARKDRKGDFRRARGNPQNREKQAMKAKTPLKKIPTLTSSTTLRLFHILILNITWTYGWCCCAGQHQKKGPLINTRGNMAPHVCPDPTFSHAKCTPKHPKTAERGHSTGVLLTLCCACCRQAKTRF